MADGAAQGTAGRIRLPEVLRYLGYAGQEVDPGLLARIEDVASRCDAELKPRWLWRAFPLEPAGPDGPAVGSRVAGTELSLAGRSIAGCLAGASGAALLACTLGAPADRRIRTLGATDPLAQLVYDAACSDLVEWAVDAVQDEIAAWARSRGLRCGRRFSPGYGDFALSVQPVLLDVLDAPRRLGLTASREHLLVPTKSVTAVVGLFPNQPAEPDLGCASCSLHASCSYRARGVRCYPPEGRGRAGEGADGPANA